MKTALITGASEGIGYALTKCFVHDGYNVILVARNEEKLKAIVAEHHAAPVTVSYYAMDLSNLDDVKNLCADLQKKNIEIEYLANNAGFGLSGNFTDLSWDDQYRMFSLDMITVAYLTHTLGQEMKKRGSGRILNVASTAAFLAIPNMAGYAASKSFVLSLSDAVNTELRDYGVTVTALCPGVTRTHFHAVAHTEKSLLGTWFLPQATPEQVANYGYRCMMKGKPIAIHHWMNRLSMGVVRILPKPLIRSILHKSLQK